MGDRGAVNTHRQYISPEKCTMSTLSVFNQDGIEIVIDTTTGESFCTQSGYAKMSGLTQQAINKRCKAYNQEAFKKAEMLSPSGLQGYNLIPAKLAFKWLLKDNPSLAEKMGEAGATVYLHQIAGYKVSSAVVPAQVFPQSSSTQSVTLVQDAILLAEAVGRVSGVAPALAAQMIVNAVIAVTPALEPTRDSLKVTVACTDTHPDALLNPSQVGKIIELGPIDVNKLLVKKGLQYRTDDKKAPYRPTEEGKKYSRIVPVVANNKNQTVFQLRWMPEIASLLR